jgi:hypothetical protein
VASQPRRHGRARIVVFALIVCCCTAAGAASVAFAVIHAHESHPPPGVHVHGGASLPPARTGTAVVRHAASLTATKGPQLLFRSAIPDKTFGKLAVAPLAHPNTDRAISDLACDRVYYANGNGLCLASTGAFSNSYVAKIFDANFAVRTTLKIPGIPSRARISSDGKLGAVTTFVNGDSYSPGNFSTRTSIVDMKAGKVVADLEKFRVLDHGKVFKKRNFNFWGVTFAHDDDHIYATLGSGSNTYLVGGSLRSKTMQVLTTHLECPSLSPDGTRIAFKQSTNSHGAWRIYVLDLKTMKRRPLAETRSIDDQVEWLDNTSVLYWHGTDIWSVPADGSGSPRMFVTDASSPAVIPAG